MGAKNHRKLKEGLILTDVSKNKLKLGKPFASGGFGDIYHVSKDLNRHVSNNSPYVAKFELLRNGPLFVERNFYVRAAKESFFTKWKKANKVSHLGVPRLITFGSHRFSQEDYRFLVLDCFGRDFGSILEEKGGKFHFKTAFNIAIQILDALEYIHFHGFIHADIKASNIVLASNKPKENRLYLVDYGLACRFVYSNGNHKEFSIDERKAHDGTLEYTSRDAHVGAHSRRGDLEILGYNMLHWISGTLPWLDKLSDPDRVASMKNFYMENIPKLIDYCFPQGNYPEALLSYFQHLSSLTFTTRPDYSHCRNLLRQCIRNAGFRDDMQLHLDSAPPRINPPNTIKGDENRGREKRVQIAKRERKPCGIIQTEEVGSRRARRVGDGGRGFDWVKVLSGHPERDIKKAVRREEKKPIPLKSISEELDESLVKEREDPRANPTPPMLLIMKRRSNSEIGTPQAAPKENVLFRRRLNDSSYYPKMTAVETRLKRKSQLASSEEEMPEKKQKLEVKNLRPRLKICYNIRKSSLRQTRKRFLQRRNLRSNSFGS